MKTQISKVHLKSSFRKILYLGKVDENCALCTFLADVSVRCFIESHATYALNAVNFVS